MVAIWCCRSARAVFELSAFKAFEAPAGDARSAGAVTRRSNRAIPPSISATSCSSRAIVGCRSAPTRKLKSAASSPRIALPAYRPGRRSHRVPAGRRPGDDAGYSAGLRGEPGFGLEFRVDYLERFLADRNRPTIRTSPADRKSARLLPDPDAVARPAHRRTARRFARTTGNPAFDPEAISAGDLASLVGRICASRPWRRSTSSKSTAKASLPNPRPAPIDLLALRESLLAQISPSSLARYRRRQDALPRRLSPGSGSARRKRFCHYRFRGRTRPHPCGTARKALAAARCRRHAALVQLCRGGGGQPQHEGTARRPPAHRSAGSGLGAGSGRRFLQGYQAAVFLAPRAIAIP